MNFIRDLSYALRFLRRQSTYTLVAVLLLALGIGANTAVFSVMRRVLLERLPVRNPQELVQLGDEDAAQAKFASEFSLAAFHIFESENSVFSGLFAFSEPMQVNVVAAGTSHLASAIMETPNAAAVLGLRPALGRLLNEGDTSSLSQTPPVILGFDYWRSQFGGDTNVLGRTITVNGVPFTIAGVFPRGFRGMTLGQREDIVLPVYAVDAVRRLPTLNNRSNWWLHIVGRRPRGTGLPQIRAALAPAFARAVESLVAAWPPAMAGNLRKYTANLRFSVRPAALGTDSGTREQLEQPLTILIAITGLVFLIACANLAGLILSRAAVRNKEIGIRLAMGCGRARLIRQLLTENLLLAVAGGTAGVCAAWWLGPALIGLLGGDRMAETIDGHPDAVTMYIGGLLVIMGGLAPGLIPALRAARFDPQSSLRQAGVPVGSGKSRLGRALIALQMAVSLVLLMTAGDFVRTVKNYRNVDAGIRPDHLVLIGVNPGLLRYSGVKTIAYTRQVRERLGSLPGVQSVTWSTSAFGGLSWTTQVRVPGFQMSAPQGDAAGRNIVGPRFVETLGLTLLAGRDFDMRDTRDAPPSVIVNESFARHFFGAENPIGRSVFFIDSLNRPHTVIGIVRDGRDRGIRTAPAPVAYTSYEHDPLGNVTFAVRTGLDPAVMLRQIGAVFHDADPLVPIFSTRTMEMQVDESLQRQRMMAALSSAFGVVAILVAAVGLYGLLAWAVGTRTREIGIRMALGARTRKIVWLAMRDAAVITGAGIVVGVPAYLGFARVIRSQVFGVTPGDPAALVAAIAALSLVAGIAAFVPAWRAGRVDPMVALRHE